MAGPTLLTWQSPDYGNIYNRTDKKSLPKKRSVSRREKQMMSMFNLEQSFMLKCIHLSSKEYVFIISTISRVDSHVCDAVIVLYLKFYV